MFKLPQNMQNPIVFSSALFNLPLRSRVSRVFQYTCNSSDSKLPRCKNAMDEKNPDQTSSGCERDVIYQSFGAKYATRCVEEGFGGVYGKNDDADPELHDNTQDIKIVQNNRSSNCDKSQVK